MDWRRVIDAAIELPVVSSFTRVGYDVRSRVDRWQPLDDFDLSGQVVVVTGATSGLGFASARQLRRCGADVVVTGRSGDRVERAAAMLREDCGAGTGSVIPVAADMGDYDQVRALAEHVLREVGRLDVLIHNAGALTAERRTAPSGAEATVASQVYGPFLLTALLLDLLADDGPGRVLTTSSGGMYAVSLDVEGLEMSAANYNGTRQYALAKRAQVTLNELWAERFGHRGIVFHAMHPGWADTPGVDDALPVFGTVVGPLLRTPEQGADTLVWLAAGVEALESNGRFWHDRRPRSPHKTWMSRAADTDERRAELWRHVCDEVGIEPG